MTSIEPEDITILIIDDEEAVRLSFVDYLEDEGYSILSAENGKIGLELLKRERPDIVLTDLRMPMMDGLDVLGLGQEVLPDIPYIVISGTGTIPDVIEAIRRGAWDYIVKPLKNLEFLKHQVQKNLEKYKLLKENEEYRNHLEELVRQRTAELEQRNRELIMSRRQIIGILSQAAEYRDYETGQHFMRVSAICGIIARNLGWDKDSVNVIELASPVHDVGKIGLADRILLKKGQLDPEEKKEMRNHTIYGRNILLSGQGIFQTSNTQEEEKAGANEKVSHSILDTAADICLYHHEYWNGKGYPSGIKGEDIPIAARITALADVYDALLSKRPYKEPWGEEKVLDYIKTAKGKQLDPHLVEIFFEHIEEIRDVRIKYQDTGEGHLQ